MLHKECSPAAEDTTWLDRHPSSHSGRLVTCVMVLYPFTLSLSLFSQTWAPDHFIQDVFRSNQISLSSDLKHLHAFISQGIRQWNLSVSETDFKRFLGRECISEDFSSLHFSLHTCKICKMLYDLSFWCYLCICSKVA